MECIKNYFRCWAIQRAASKQAPGEILLREPSVSKQNFCSVYLEAPEDRTEIVKDVRNSRVFLERQSGMPDKRIASEIDRQQLSDFAIRIVSYTGYIERHYNNSLCFLLDDLLRINVLRNRREQFLRDKYNDRSFQRGQRMDVLKETVDLKFEGQDGVTASSLIYGRFGTRIAEHPDVMKLHDQYEFLLDSFCESGDMVKVGSTYQVAPKSLATLDSYEDSERHHKDSLRLQSRVVILTTALVVVGLPPAVKIVLEFWK